MAKDFISYIKETTDSVFNGGDNAEKRKKALEELSAFLAEAAKADELPERPDFSDRPAYDRITVEEKNEDEIRTLAESVLDGYKNSSVTAIEKDIELLEKKLEAEKESKIHAAESKAASLEGAYGTAKKEVDDDMLRRGLARSSIAANKNAELSDAKANRSVSIASELSDAVKALDTEIASLGAKREKALADFNIAYAAKLTEQIMTLKNEQEKKVTEALKYNNSLSEKEHEAEISAKQKEADIYGKELSIAEKERQLKGGNQDEATYKKMCELLDGLNGADARALVMENAMFRDNLSDYYYYKLYDRYTR